MQSAAEDKQALLQRVKQELEASQARSKAQQGQQQQQQPCWVHTGFLTAYDSLRPALLSMLGRVLEEEPEGGDEAQLGWRILLTGHSLGGALATPCAWDTSHRAYVLRHIVPASACLRVPSLGIAAAHWPRCCLPAACCRWDYRKVPQLTVVNLGSPRVCNRAFADSYNQRVPDTWRIVGAVLQYCAAVGCSSVHCRALPVLHRHAPRPRPVPFSRLMPRVACRRRTETTRCAACRG